MGISLENSETKSKINYNWLHFIVVDIRVKRVGLLKNVLVTFIFQSEVNLQCGQRISEAAVQSVKSEIEKIVYRRLEHKGLRYRPGDTRPLNERDDNTLLKETMTKSYWYCL